MFFLPFPKHVHSCVCAHGCVHHMNVFLPPCLCTYINELIKLRTFNFPKNHALTRVIIHSADAIPALAGLLSMPPAHLRHLVYSAMIRDSHLQPHIWKLLNKLLAVSFLKLFKELRVWCQQRQHFPRACCFPLLFLCLYQDFHFRERLKTRLRAQRCTAQSQKELSFWEDRV